MVVAYTSYRIRNNLHLDLWNKCYLEKIGNVDLEDTYFEISHA